MFFFHGATITSNLWLPWICMLDLRLEKALFERFSKQTFRVSLSGSIAIQPKALGIVLSLGDRIGPFDWFY